MTFAGRLGRRDLTAPGRSRLLTDTESSFILRPLGAKNARANIQGKYGQGDQQGPAPGQLLPVGVGALHEVVDGDRQVGHRLGQIEAEELVATAR